MLYEKYKMDGFCYSPIGIINHLIVLLGENGRGECKERESWLSRMMWSSGSPFEIYNRTVNDSDVDRLPWTWYDRHWSLDLFCVTLSSLWVSHFRTMGKANVLEKDREWNTICQPGKSEDIWQKVYIAVAKQVQI